MPYLKYISDKELIEAVAKVIKVIEKAECEADDKLHKNVVDPFSALFHGITHKISYKEWIEQEKARQIQKTMQNAIGTFHQDILGSVKNWEDLGTGGGLDVKSNKYKILAEIKNKYNTTKGNHKTELYDAIKAMLRLDEYNNFIGYYVEIIPKGKNKYDNPFTPSDNKRKKRRPKNKKIRVIDGVSFYEMATGREKALQELFEVLPMVIADNFKYKLGKKETSQYFDLFKKAFSTE